jgi:hypothetical protein
VLATREVPVFDSKLSAVAFGVFIPFFFVMSGMRLDVDALFSSASGLAKLAIFVLFQSPGSEVAGVDDPAVAPDRGEAGEDDPQPAAPTGYV